MPAATEGKNGCLAVFLSFLIPGLGQFYVGQIGKGIMFIILGLVAWGLNVTIVGLIIGIPMCFIVYIWSMVDAYKACQ